MPLSPAGGASSLVTFVHSEGLGPRPNKGKSVGEEAAAWLLSHPLPLTSDITVRTGWHPASHKVQSCAFPKGR